VLEWHLDEDKTVERLEFWRDLNDFAVSQRGKSARSEFRSVEK